MQVLKKFYRLTVTSYDENDSHEPYNVDYDTWDKAMRALDMYENETFINGCHAYSAYGPSVIEKYVDVPDNSVVFSNGTTCLPGELLEPYDNFFEAEKIRTEASLSGQEFLARQSMTPRERFELTFTESVSNFVKYVSSDENRVRTFAEAYICGYSVAQEFIKNNPDFIKSVIDKVLLTEEN